MQVLGIQRKLHFVLQLLLCALPSCRPTCHHSVRILQRLVDFTVGSRLALGATKVMAGAGELLVFSGSTI